MRPSYFIPHFALLSLFIAGCSGGGDFQSASDMNVPRHGHTALRLPSGKILIAAGLTKTSPLASMEIYDPAKAAFAPMPSAGLLARGWHRAASVRGGGILLTGGWTKGNRALREAALLPRAGARAIKILTKLGRYDHTATRLDDGSVLITGGNDGKRAIRSMEIYSSRERKFIPTARPLLVARQQHTATLLPGGGVIITGGGRGRGARFAEIYEPAARRTRLARSFTTPRSRHTATRIAGGGVLIAGGLGEKETLRSAELFDPRSRTFTRIKMPMRQARQQHTATRLPDGRVLLLGGWGGGGKTLASGELFLPERSCFVALGSVMKHPRRLHTATLLDAKSVLITGGASDNEVLRSAEIFTIPPKGGAPGC